MHFPTASRSVAALSFLLAATRAQVIDPNNPQSLSNSPTTPAPHQRLTPPPPPQPSCIVTIGGETFNTCDVPHHTEEPSSTTEAPDGTPTIQVPFEQPCTTTISGTVFDLCNDVSTSGESSMKPSTTQHSSSFPKVCITIINGEEFNICNAHKATGEPSPATTVAPHHTLQVKCFKTINGVVFNTCNAWWHSKHNSTAAAVSRPTQGPCRVTDSNGHAQNTCDQPTSDSTSAPSSQTTAHDKPLQSACWETINGQTFDICDLVKTDAPGSSATAPATQSYVKQEL